MFWLGRHTYTGFCLHANDTQTTCYWVTHCCERNFSLYLSFLEQFAYWHFAGCRSQDCMKMAYSKFTAKRKVDSENQQFEEEWSEKYAFILPSTSTRPMCLICQFEMKHRKFEETFPQNSEVRTTKMNALKSSYQAATVFLSHLWHNNKKCSLRNVFLLVPIFVVVLNEMDIQFIYIFIYFIQYYCMWPDRLQYMDLWVFMAL